MWNTTKFEKHLDDRLKAEADDKATQLFSTYGVTRGKLVENIFRDIPAIQPDLSDHGPEHIAHVLTNAGYLLSYSHETHGLSAIDLYLLAMVILFHDVGNLFGREDHHKKIGEVFDWARGTDASVRREKTLVLTAARAHTGLASDGSHDTLKEVSETDQLFGESVQLRTIAAVLRFADELAEGPSRTSEFRRRHALYHVDNRIYHDYASVTHIRADRGTERIMLAYEIDVSHDPSVSSASRSEALGTLLTFIYERVLKLNQERRYARFYCSTLAPFKATEVSFTFHCAGSLLPVDLPSLRIDDKVIPGEPAKAIADYDGRYAIGSLVDAVMAAAQGMIT